MVRALQVDFSAQIVALAEISKGAGYNLYHPRRPLFVQPFQPLRRSRHTLVALCGKDKDLSGMNKIWIPDPVSVGRYTIAYRVPSLRIRVTFGLREEEDADRTSKTGWTDAAHERKRGTTG